MKLKTLLERVEIQNRIGSIDEELDIPHISNDSREIGKGDIFVAMKGVLVDGHDYIEEAIKRGAALIVCDHEVSIDIPQIVVSNPRMALADLA